jgi:hypothetical protein
MNSIVIVRGWGGYRKVPEKVYQWIQSYNYIVIKYVQMYSRKMLITMFSTLKNARKKDF